ncbi:hypothetical protein BDV93DRAFT_604012 [Ceratobasidium sp. AG-I]|nr:hypothetical protein BDV93DRAFT_604012 [Ceratobasidium sp. AG-I]
MNPPNPTFIPGEMHLMILESFLNDKSLYSPVEKEYQYTSVSKWIGLSLVCRAWRNRIYSIAFRRLSVPHKSLAALRDIAFLSTPQSKFLPAILASIYTPTLNYVHDLTWSVAATDYLPEVISILVELPHLNDLTIKLHIPGEKLDLGNSTHPEYIIPQVKRLRILLFHPTCGIRLESTGVRWVLSAFPSVEHLHLFLPRVDDCSDPNLSLNHCLPPNLISLALEGWGWFPGLFGRQLAIPTLRFFEIWYARIHELQPFADYHGNTLEGLRFIRMVGDNSYGWDKSANVPEGWGTFIPKFNSLRYLSIGNEDIEEIRLEPIKSQHLRHFDFTMSKSIGSEEMAAITELVTQRCPNLQAVTYRDYAESARMQELEGACSVSVIRKPIISFGLPDDECFYGYTCWEDTISPNLPFPPVWLAESSDPDTDTE